ncbi:hypothetical protein ACFZAV_45215 [Streptomyces sp. NPDC008343]|uniref:hypothetical protein n=1 Tax=Streptomyces sp. NPDC008343 TaxID=3364828 RepID=UPI0036ECA27F
MIVSHINARRGVKAALVSFAALAAGAAAVVPATAATNQTAPDPSASSTSVSCAHTPSADGGLTVSVAKDTPRGPKPGSLLPGNTADVTVSGAPGAEGLVTSKAFVGGSAQLEPVGHSSKSMAFAKIADVPAGTYAVKVQVPGKKTTATTTIQIAKTPLSVSVAKDTPRGPKPGSLLPGNTADVTVGGAPGAEGLVTSKAFVGGSAQLEPVGHSSKSMAFAKIADVPAGTYAVKVQVPGKKTTATTTIQVTHHRSHWH